MRAPERLIDEYPEPQPPSGLMERTAGWAALAAASVMATLLAANTPDGAIRIDQALATLSQPLAGERVAASAAPPSNQSAENDREIAEAVRRLAADRDRLASRVGTLERSLDDITGSIRAGTAQPAEQSASPPAVANVSHELVREETVDSVPARTADPVAPKEYGVDLGSAQTLSGARHLWSAMRKRFSPLLSDVEPLVSTRKTKNGKNEMRLVAGPVEDARAAARLCASLGITGTSCDLAIYDGQQLPSQ